MKLHKFYLMLIATAAAAIETYPALAARQWVGDGAPELATPLLGPGVLGLVVVGIVAAVAIARWRK
ncbi:MAG: hypothetical protein OEM98_10790 [Gammaproteobacteria bacterium]|nr:hypothetical protein [Gammaproteobacteria bacterium]